MKPKLFKVGFNCPTIHDASCFICIEDDFCEWLPEVFIWLLFGFQPICTTDFVHLVSQADAAFAKQRSIDGWVHLDLLLNSQVTLFSKTPKNMSKLRVLK